MTVEGSVTIENTLDVQAMANVCVVTGNVTVAADALTSISFPVLASVGGSVNIGDNAALTSCTGLLIVNVGDCVQ